MNEIDPMVQQLVDSAVHHTAVYRNGDSNRKRVNELSRKLTARLAQPTVTRAQIEAVLLSELARTTTIAAITDAVMAVVAPDTAGGVGDGQGN